MNYMEEVAKMLGVEVGEHFECDDNYWLGLTFWFTDTEFVCNGVHAADSLMMFLNGTLTIKRKPWKPKLDERYWHIDVDGSHHLTAWQGVSYDMNYYRLGNCYKTSEEAKANRDKWVAFYASDEVLDV